MIACGSELCEAAVKLCREINYDNAGTVEFLYDLDTKEWFFIEMNPRIQVEHTVTEVITGVDLVRAQIMIADNLPMHGPEVGIPLQHEVARNGYAVQCRITTEDPENKFQPDYGRVLTYRSSGGYGVRLDGGMGYAGAVITPFYDSLLVKLTAFSRTFESALARMDRALREFRIRGVKTNIPFLENVIHNSTFRSGQATTTLIDTTPELFKLKHRRDRATKLLTFIGDVTVNGNPEAKGYVVTQPFDIAKPPAFDHRQPPPDGTRQLLLKLGPKKFADWALKEKRLLVTDSTFRDAHQSLFATRLRTADMLAAADAMARRTPNLFSVEMWGGATFDTSLRFLHEDPWKRLRALREKIPNICFQMLFRGSNAVGYSNYPDNAVAGFVKHAAESGIDIFRIFDSLNYLPNLKVAMDAVQETHAICEAAICYTGNILDPARKKYSLRYYVKLAKELERMGAHILAIKDMAGLCRPAAAYAGQGAEGGDWNSDSLPYARCERHGGGLVLEAANAGVDAVDLAIASMSGSTSQPNLNSVVAALQSTRRDTGLDLVALNEFADYWELVRDYYAPFDTAPKTGSAEVYLHEMPGGQFTNLKEQARGMGILHHWPEIARTYAEVNQLFGDIVKVTPSSKVVGDMTMFLITHGIKPADVVNLEPGGTPFPESVIDMLSGGLGHPMGGWPKKLQHVVLGNRKPIKGRPGASMKPLNLKKVQSELEARLKHEVTLDDVYSYVMYPAVFNEFARKSRGVRRSLGPAHTGVFLRHEGGRRNCGRDRGRQNAVHPAGESQPGGCRREAHDSLRVERHAAATHHHRPRGTTEGQAAREGRSGDRFAGGRADSGAGDSHFRWRWRKVAKGDKLITLEAMKMQTTIYAPCDGLVDQVLMQVGDTVESKDLLMKLKEA